MKERPILMYSESVRAFLDGRKGQTRRVIKPQPPEGHWWAETSTEMALASQYYPGEQGRKGCPYGVPGDRLWVRETTKSWHKTRDLVFGQYRATLTPVIGPPERQVWPHGRALWWYSKPVCPSIFMPRWASRITLEVVRVRPERLQDICIDDLRGEGCPAEHDLVNCNGMSHAMYGWFEHLWDSINAKRGYSWESNPWVWVMEFKAVEP